jgi:hypothetical protein
MRRTTVVTLGVCAIAGLTALRMSRLVAHWRRTHLTFDFPFEEHLFIG